MLLLPSSRVFQDKIEVGWLAWPPVLRMYQYPLDAASAFQPWDSQSQDAVRAIRETVVDERYWRELASQLAEENQVEVVTQDNISNVKSICMCLPFRSKRNLFNSKSQSSSWR